MKFPTLAKKTKLIIVVLITIICQTNLLSQCFLPGDYFPLKLGNKWIFEVNDIANTIGNRELFIYAQHFDQGIDKRYEARFTENINGVVDTNRFVIYDDPMDDNAINTIGNINLDPNLFFSALHRPELFNQFIDNDGNINNVKLVESISTPAGVFNCCYYIYRNVPDTDIEYGFVYAPDVGPVAYRYNGVDLMLLSKFEEIDIYGSKEEASLLDGSIIGVDDLDGVFLGNQLIVQFEPNIPETEREILRQDSFGVVDFKTCICNEDLELWIFDTTFTEIIEKKKKAEASSCVEKISNNYIVFDETERTIPIPIQAFPLTAVLPTGIEMTDHPDSLVLITVPDTGIDFDSLNATELAYIYANDQLNIPNSNWGWWSFVDEHNNPQDNHFGKHGTAVIKKIINYLINADVTAEDVKILPVKTHREEGKGLLFDATCALYYGMKAEADIINVSWGYYGATSNVLQFAIDSLASSDIILVTGAGNKGRNLDTLSFYPAIFPHDNILVATSLDQNNQLANFANRSSTHVDVGQEAIRGTSFAAPILSAIVSKGMSLWKEELSNQEIIEQIFDCADRDFNLFDDISDGRILNLDLPCIVIPEPNCLTGIDVFPNPSANTLKVYINEIQTANENIDLKIYDQLGRELINTKVERFVQGDLFEFNVALLASGNYYLAMLHEEEVLSVCKFSKF